MANQKGGSMIKSKVFIFVWVGLFCSSLWGQSEVTLQEALEEVQEEFQDEFSSLEGFLTEDDESEGEAEESDGWVFSGSAGFYSNILVADFDGTKGPIAIELDVDWNQWLKQAPNNSNGELEVSYTLNPHFSASIGTERHSLHNSVFAGGSYKLPIPLDFTMSNYLTNDGFWLFELSSGWSSENWDISAESEWKDSLIHERVFSAHYNIRPNIELGAYYQYYPGNRYQIVQVIDPNTNLPTIKRILVHNHGPLGNIDNNPVVNPVVNPVINNNQNNPVDPVATVAPIAGDNLGYPIPSLAGHSFGGGLRISF